MPRGLVDALDVAFVRRVTRSMPGDRRAAGVGAGTELAQLRPYQFGDDVRHLDSAASARTGIPHVRLHVPERTLTTWLVLDVSPSMAFGTARRLKSDVAEGVTLVIGQLAVRRAGAVGLVRYGAGEPRVLPPRGSKPGLVALRKALAEGVVPDGHGRPGALAEALVRLRKLMSAPGLVVIVSDFRDQDGWIDSLGVLGVRHSVLAVEIGDPREQELPDMGVLALVDPETGRRVEVDTNSRQVRDRFAALERERRAFLATEFQRLRISHAVLSTSEDWLAQLGRRLA